MSPTDGGLLANAGVNFPALLDWHIRKRKEKQGAVAQFRLR